MPHVCRITKSETFRMAISEDTYEISVFLVVGPLEKNMKYDPLRSREGGGYTRTLVARPLKDLLFCACLPEQNIQNKINNFRTKFWKELPFIFLNYSGNWRQNFEPTGADTATCSDGSTPARPRPTRSLNQSAPP